MSRNQHYHVGGNFECAQNVTTEHITGQNVNI